MTKILTKSENLRFVGEIALLFPDNKKYYSHVQMSCKSRIRRKITKITGERR